MHVYIGNATRFCTLEGVWEAVNTDNCTREVIISLSNTVRLCSYCIALQKNNYMQCMSSTYRTYILFITIIHAPAVVSIPPLQANELFSRNASQNNASQNEVDNLLVSLAEATSVNATGVSTIFPQDLSTTNMIVKSSVNYLVQNVEIASPVSSLNFSEVRLIM